MHRSLWEQHPLDRRVERDHSHLPGLRCPLGHFGEGGPEKGGGEERRGDKRDTQRKTHRQRQKWRETEMEIKRDKRMNKTWG